MSTTKDLGIVTAYGYALEAGYTGTKAEFTELMGMLAEEVSNFENFTVVVTTLAAGSEATASYEDGVLTLGIPKGDKGDQGIQGIQGETGKSAYQAAVEAGYTGTEPQFEAAMLEVANVSEDVTDLKSAIATKAEQNGYYTDLTAGSAEQLLSTTYETDTEPYNFRTSGGSADIGTIETDKIVGGTVAWNQNLMADKNRWGALGGTSLTSSDNTIVATVTGFNYQFGFYLKTSYKFIKTGHKYLFSVEVTASKSGTILYGSEGQNKTPNVTAGAKTKLAHVLSSTGEGTILMYLKNSTDGFSVGETLTVSNYMCFDLTQMFGSTIADYIYSLEQSTTGAGVAWFRKYFPNDYYEYNAGELMSVQAARHEMVGFNAYDSSTGNADVIGGNQYQITGAYTAISLDGETITPDSSGFFTPPANGELTVTGGGNNTCVHLVWSGYRNGEYKPYVKHTYALDDSLTLRGVPKLVDGKLEYDGDTYESDGTVTRRYGVVDLGTLNWTYNPSLNRAYTNSLASLINGSRGNLYSKTSNGFYSVSSLDILKETEGTYFISSSNVISFNLNGATSASEFTSAINGVYFIYPLATEITETAAEYTNPQAVDDFGTEAYIDAAVEAGDRDVSIPVGHETQYLTNLRDKLQHLPDLSSSGNGTYVIQQTDSQMTLVPLTTSTELPTAPTTDGAYTLQATVSNGVVTYSWS